MDITDFSGGQAKKPSRPVFRRITSNESLSVPQNEAAQEFRKNHWTIDKFVEDGQVEALPDDGKPPVGEMIE